MGFGGRPSRKNLSPSEQKERTDLRQKHAEWDDSGGPGLSRKEKNRLNELTSPVGTVRGGMRADQARTAYRGQKGAENIPNDPEWTVVSDGFGGVVARPPAKMTQSGWEEYPSRTEQYNQQFGQRQSDIDVRNRQNAQASAEAAARAQAQRQAEIRQSQLADLDRRIEFEKDNPLIERRQSASGRFFEAISPGQQYTVAAGGDRLSGKFERMPFISREEYNKQKGRGEQRILGRGRVRPKGVLGDEEETLGQSTVLGV